MKRSICILLALALLLGCTACGSSGRVGRFRIIRTLVKQDYSLAFRVGDPTKDYVDAALKVLMARGAVDELAVKWFGERIIRFDRDPDALEKLQKDGEIAPRDLIVGVDLSSYPMAYLTKDGQFWGFDIELSMTVASLLGWNLIIQPIEKDNVYIELKEDQYSQLGPYVHNDIVIAARIDSFIFNNMMLSGKRLAMCSTAEAMDALNTDPRLVRRLGQISRFAEGTDACFHSLFSGESDVVLIDTMAIYYVNCH